MAETITISFQLKLDEMKTDALLKLHAAVTAEVASRVALGYGPGKGKANDETGSAEAGNNGAEGKDDSI